MALAKDAELKDISSRLSSSCSFGSEQSPRNFTENETRHLEGFSAG